MSLLFKNLRIHQVFGANTDVGKTLLTAALVRASAAKEKQVFYLKPVSTGPLEDADDAHVKRFAGPNAKLVHPRCLFRFDEPVSPHLAATMAIDAGKKEVVIPSDEAFVNSVASHIRQMALYASDARPSHMYVETAGGVHSPTLSGTTQLDAYRPLFLPTILVGDSRLGGISSTISAYESLLLRGYIVDAILLFRDAYYRNFEYLNPYFAERGVHVTAVEPPPDKQRDFDQNFATTEKYYASVAQEGRDGGVAGVVDHLDACHQKRLAELDSMPRRTLDTVWWPFVQHEHVQRESDVNVIDSAHADFFTIFNGKKQPSTTSTTKTTPSSLLQPQLDGSASWWTQALGHAHPRLALAAARAAGRYGHVMFPTATHLPALKLAERLVHEGPGKGWASRAFFSDDGSTGMEVALKMALRAFSSRHGLQGADRKKLGVLGLRGATTDAGVYTCEWHNAKGFWFDPPSVAIRKGKTVVRLPAAIAARTEEGAEDVETGSLSWTYDVEKRLVTPLAGVYRDYISTTLEKLREKGEHRLAALVVEPLVMGAGGMIFVDPLFQRVLVDVVRGTPASSSAGDWSGMPVIFDEVFVGLYRLGQETTSPLLGVAPDVSVHAKILTGGLVPLAVTLASDAIFKAFWSEKKTDALLHGHSYTAHAVGCEVANETLRILDGIKGSEAWAEAKGRWLGGATEDAKDETAAVWSFWDPSFVDALSRSEAVEEVMTMGTVLAIKIKDEGAGYASTSAQSALVSLAEVGQQGEQLTAAPGGAPYNVHYRTLGDVAYFMLSLNTPPSLARSMEDKIWRALLH